MWDKSRQNYVEEQSTIWLEVEEAEFYIQMVSIPPHYVHLLRYLRLDLLLLCGCILGLCKVDCLVVCKLNLWAAEFFPGKLKKKERKSEEDTSLSGDLLLSYQMLDDIIGRCEFDSIKFPLPTFPSL